MVVSYIGAELLNSKDITKDNIFKEAEKGNLEILKQGIAFTYRDYQDSQSKGLCFPEGYFDEDLSEEDFDDPEDFEEYLDDKICFCEEHPWDKDMVYGCSECTECDANTPFHVLASTGEEKVLKNPKVSTVRNCWGETPLHIFAKSKNGILCVNHPEISSALDDDGETPLCVLAKNKEFSKEIISHPNISKIASLESSESPLHIMGKVGSLIILNHKDVDKVKDFRGKTPLENLSDSCEIPRWWLTERYPWFNLGRKKITPELISTILKEKEKSKHPDFFPRKIEVILVEQEIPQSSTQLNYIKTLNYLKEDV